VLIACLNSIIATPGRLLHLIVEMNLDLKSVQYVVFDEADRLFELGFSTALHEILHKLPTSRQTLLFSATLPKTLVEFAKAGLQNPKLVRLDAESKISSDLRMAFFSVKQAEKDACLLSLLRDVIKVPQDGNNRRDVSEEDEDDSKRKQGKGKAKEIQTAPHQTLVFVATKHHVEYVSNLVSTAGYSVSYIYGALDQTARGLQMDRFRRGLTSVLVVTDVAARGIDIPVLENVVNYDFPQGARVFVHRVGRTARAGRKGWAWSFITNSELPHLLDLQLFLDRPLTTKASDGEMAYTENLVLGTFKRATVDEDVEYIRVLDEKNGSLPTLREVMRRGQGMYERSMGKASPASYKRAKEMVKSGRWGLTGSAGEEGTVHPVLSKDDEEGKADEINLEEARQAMIQAVNSFRPNETIFEVGSRGKTPAALLMKDRRKSLSKAIKRTVVDSPAVDDAGDGDVDALEREGSGQVLELADEDDLEVHFLSILTKRLLNIFHFSRPSLAVHRARKLVRKKWITKIPNSTCHTTKRMP
jgi:ATP-dependent RNA helicase DDX54/DBP10